MVVDQRLKPSVVGSIDVSMNDGNGNLIKKWDRVFTTKGNCCASVALDYRKFVISFLDSRPNLTISCARAKPPDQTFHDIQLYIAKRKVQAHGKNFKAFLSI